MIKLGIYKKSQLSYENLLKKRNKRKFVAADLYPEINNLDTGNRKKELLEDLILNKFSLANGSYKRTHKNRFADFDKITVNLIKENFDKEIKVHDLAVSDGRTSVDFFKLLSKEYENKIYFTASDKEYIFFLKKEKLYRLIKDKYGNTLQIIFPPFVFNMPKPESSLYYPLNKIIKFLVINFIAKGLKESKNMNELEEIKLISHRAKKAIQENKNFSFNEYDITKPSNEKYDVIRAMNVLNESYFDKKIASEIIDNITDSLKDNGLLIAGSNQGSGTQINGSIFKKSGNKLITIKKIGRGLQFHNLI